MDESELLRERVRQWKDAAPVLEALRRKEIREADNLQVLALLESAFNHAIHDQPPRLASGMVEMQAAFARMRNE